MTDSEARAILQAAVDRAENPDARARLEVVREYLTNPAFRLAVQDEVFAITQRRFAAQRAA